MIASFPSELINRTNVFRIQQPQINWEQHTAEEAEKKERPPKNKLEIFLFSIYFSSFFFFLFFSCSDVVDASLKYFPLFAWLFGVKSKTTWTKYNLSHSPRSHNGQMVWMVWYRGESQTNYENVSGSSRQECFLFLVSALGSVQFSSAQLSSDRFSSFGLFCCPTMSLLLNWWQQHKKCWSVRFKNVSAWSTEIQKAKPEIHFGVLTVLRIRDDFFPVYLCDTDPKSRQ